jgi:hypothetical protein
MIMQKPVGGIYMDLDISCPVDLLHDNTGIEEVGSGVPVPVAGMNDLYHFTACSQQVMRDQT